MRLIKGFLFIVGLICFIVGVVGVVWVADSREVKGSTALSGIDLTKSVPAAGIRSLDIRSDIGEIVLTPTTGNELKAHFTGSVTDANKEKWKLNADTKPDGTWVVEASSGSGSRFHIGLDVTQLLDALTTGSFSNQARLEITLPQITYDNILVQTDTGRISLGDAQAGSLEAAADTGAINLSSFKGKTIKLHTDTGSINFKNVSASENVTATTNTGRVNGSLTELSCPVSLQADTGAVSLDLPPNSPALFDLSSDIGHINLNAAGNLSYEKRDRSHIIATMGSGMQRVHLQTDTGVINVNAR